MYISKLNQVSDENQIVLPLYTRMVSLLYMHILQKQIRSGRILKVKKCLSSLLSHMPIYRLSIMINWKAFLPGIIMLYMPMETAL